jgi:hypothetical protein
MAALSNVKGRTAPEEENRRVGITKWNFATIDVAVSGNGRPQKVSVPIGCHEAPDSPDHQNQGHAAIVSLESLTLNTRHYVWGGWNIRSQEWLDFDQRFPKTG